MERIQNGFTSLGGKSTRMVRAGLTRGRFFALVFIESDSTQVRFHGPGRIGVLAWPNFLSCPPAPLVVWHRCALRAHHPYRAELLGGCVPPAALVQLSGEPLPGGVSGRFRFAARKALDFVL